MKSILPDKPSELIRVALCDLRSCEANPNFTIRMWDWFTHRKDDTCTVCLAGAVMARKFDAAKHFAMDATPSWMAKRGACSVEDASKLSALNEFRCGYMGYGLRSMDIPYVGRENFPVADYHTDKDQFYRDMQKLIDHLESHNL